MTNKFQHEWSFMANHGSIGNGDLNYCPLCNQWSMSGYKGGRPFKMTNSEYMEWYINGKIDANAQFGSVERAKAIYRNQYGA